MLRLCEDYWMVHKKIVLLVKLECVNELIKVSFVAS